MILLKRIIFIVTVVLWTSLMSITASAENDKRVTIVVNGDEIETTGIIKDNRTLIPVRGVFEKLNYNVEWDASTKTAYISGADYEIVIQSKRNDFDCKKIETGSILKIKPDVSQQIIDGYFYIPLRAVSEAIDAEVSWDSTSYIAMITKNLRAKIDVDKLESKAIKQYLNEEDIIYIDQLDEVYELELSTEELTTNVLNDLKMFPNLYEVRYIGEPVEDFSALKNFIKENENSRINFYLPNEKDYVDNSNIDKYIDYYNIKKKIVNEIISKNDTDFDKVLAIHDYIVLHTDYDYTNFKKNKIPDEDYDPYYVLKDGKGVCDGYTRATMALLSMAGIENEYVSGTANGVSSWGSHAWVIVKLNGSYYHMDVTFDDPVKMPSDYIQWDYFLKSDSTMSIDHKWEKSEHAKCKSDYGYTPPYDYFDLYDYESENEYYNYDEYYYDNDNYY